MLAQFLLRFLAFVCGGYFVFEFFSPQSWKESLQLEKINPVVLNALTTVSAFAVGLGVINLFITHGKRVFGLYRRWFFSLVLLSSFLITTFCGFYSFVYIETRNLQIKFLEALETNSFEVLSIKYPSIARKIFLACPIEDSSCLQILKDQLNREIEQSKSGLVSNIFKVLSEGLLFPLGAAMFSLLAFYIASASYRAFRFRSLFGLVLLASALIVILGQNSLWLSQFEFFLDLRAWLLNNVSMAAFRAITFGALIGGLILAIRIWLGMEKLK